VGGRSRSRAFWTPRARVTPCTPSGNRRHTTEVQPRRPTPNPKGPPPPLLTGIVRPGKQVRRNDGFLPRQREAHPARRWPSSGPAVRRRVTTRPYIWVNTGPRLVGSSSTCCSEQRAGSSARPGGRLWAKCRRGATCRIRPAFPTSRAPTSRPAARPRIAGGDSSKRGQLTHRFIERSQPSQTQRDECYPRARRTASLSLAASWP